MVTGQAPLAAHRRLIIAVPGEPVDEAGDVLVRRHGEVLLDTILRLGWTAPYACRRGGCGVCVVQLHRGKVRHGPHTERALSQSAETEDGLALACRALPLTPLVEIEFCQGDARRVAPISVLTREPVGEQ